MNRRSVTGLLTSWLVLLQATVWLPRDLGGTVALGAERPNILVILCDDLGYGDLECFGHPHIQTPNLNRLAETGIRLTDCYSAAPVCSPSRVGLLTGRSPNRAGIYDWIPAAGDEAKPDARDQVHLRKDEVTVAHLLKQAGYATCMSGKWHCNAKFNSLEQPQPGDAGFDYWFGTQNNAAPTHENPVNYVRNGADVGPLEGFSCQLAATEAIDWMNRHQRTAKDQPFFVYLAFHEPHEPVASPPELVERYRGVARNEDEAHFFANVANVDRAVGRVVASLEEQGLRENTLIFFSSDNGPETLNRYRGANRSYGRPTPLRGMKLWTTDAGFRVAGIVNWPAKIRAGSVCSQVVSSLDLLPTFCQLAEVRPPVGLQLDGTSIAPIFSGETVVRSKPLIWCYFNALNEHCVAMRDGQWKMLAKLDGGDLPKIQNVYDGNRDRILKAQLTDFELYQVASDVGEQEDVFSKEPQAALLQQKLADGYRELLESSHYWTAR